MMTLTPLSVGVFGAPSETGNLPHSLPSLITVIVCVESSTVEMCAAPVVKSEVRLSSKLRPGPADRPLTGRSMWICACAGQ